MRKVSAVIRANAEEFALIDSLNCGNPLTAPVDYLGAVAKAQQHSVKQIDIAAINKAIELFQVDKGRYPTDLNELVKEKFLPEIPATPYGTKIVYDSDSGEVKIVKQ